MLTKQSSDCASACRRMVEAEEVHYKLASGSGECARVKQVKCARVYHLNLVLRVKTRNLPDAEQDVRDTNKVMHMERARLVVNQQGILRLQSLGELTSVFCIKLGLTA